VNREELAAQIFAVSCYKGGQPCADSFAQADKFLDYAAKQRKPKACEHVWHEGAHGNFFCTLCRVAKVNPEPPKPDVCEYCGDTFKEGDGHSRTTIGPMPVLSCPKHPTNQPSFTMKQPEPPKPERVAREWWIRYPLLTPNGACVPEVWPDSDKHANIFEGDKWIKVREILPGDER